MRIPRKPALTAAGAVAVVLAAVLLGCVPSRPARHLVLVVFDTLRADQMSLYGHERPTTPFLEQLARESILYADVKSPASWTVPSHSSLFTGLWPADHRAQWGRIRLDESFVTLAEHLSDEGFCTVGLSANPLAGPKTGLAQGFERFRVISGPWRDKTAKILKQVPEVLERAQTEDCRLFLFINLMDAHIPFNSFEHGSEFGLQEPGPVRNARIKWEISDGQRDFNPEMKARHGSAYEAAVRALDDAARELVERLATAGILDDTLLVFTSDHGEGLGDHPEIGHSISVWEEQLAIPLLVRLPGAERGGEAVLSRRSLVALAPTLLDRLGIGRPQHLQGAVTLEQPGRPVLADYRSYFREAQRRANLKMAETYPQLAARIVDQHVIYCDRFKLITDANGRVSLFDLAADPTELTDLAGRKEARVALRRCRTEYRHLLAGGFYTPFGDQGEDDIELEPADLETLRALGYVQ